MSQKQAACARLSESHGRTKKLKVWANGDPKCYVFNINPKEFRNWSVIMSHLTQKMLPTFGAIKALVELKTKKMITEFEGLDPRRKYIGIGATCTSLRMPMGGYKTSEELNRQAQRESKMNAASKGEKVNESKKFLKKTEKMQNMVIYIVVNGSDETPQKAVFKRDELKHYDLIRSYLANILKMSDRIQNLYTTSGVVLADATEFKHGSMYVAVPVGQNFQKMDYVGLFKEKYPFCKKNKYIKVVASRHSYIVLKRKLSCEKAKASKKIGTPSRHSVHSQVPPMYTFKSIASERKTVVEDQQTTMESRKSLPLYNQIKSRQSQFIHFTIRPAPREPEIPKQLYNSRKITKFIRQRLAEKTCKITRSNIYSKETAEMMNNLPQSSSMPAEAQSRPSRMMKVFKNISLTSGVENILGSGEASGKREPSDQNAMYQYLQSLGRIESIENPEMDVYFKALLENIVKIVEKKSEHKPRDNNNIQDEQQKQHMPLEEVTNEPMVEQFRSLHHSGAKISIEIKQMSEEKLSNVQQIPSGNKLFNVKVTYQPSIEAVNLIKTLQDSKEIKNRNSEQKVSREVIIVNDQMKERKMTPKTSNHVSVKISMGSNSNTTNRSFILQERGFGFPASKTDSSNRHTSKGNMISDEGGVVEPISDIKEKEQPMTNNYTIDTSSKVCTKTSNNAAIRVLSNKKLISKTSNRSQINNIAYQENEVNKQLPTELNPIMSNQFSTDNEQLSYRNSIKEDIEKFKEPIIQNRYFNEQNNLVDNINKLETIKTQIPNEGSKRYNEDEDVFFYQQGKHVDDDLIQDSVKHATDNRKQEDNDIKILFEQSICESSTQQFCSDSFERTSMSSSSGTQQLNMERAGDISGSSMHQLDDKSDQRKTVSGVSVRHLVIDKVKTSANQVDTEKCKTSNISGSRIQQDVQGDKKTNKSGYSMRSMENTENRVDYESIISQKVGENNKKVNISGSNIKELSTTQLPVKSLENHDISRSSISNTKTIHNRSVSGSSTPQIAVKNLEAEPNMLAAKSFENRLFSRSSTQHLFEKSVEKQTSDAKSNIVADEYVKNGTMSRLSTQKLATGNIERLGVKSGDKLNNYGSSTLVAQDIGNKTINASNTRLAAENSVEQINNSRLSMLSAKIVIENRTMSGSSMLATGSVENVANYKGKEQTNISRTSIMTGKGVEQQVISRSFIIDARNIEIEKTATGTIPQLSAKSGEQINVCESNLIVADNIETSSSPKSSIQIMNTRSGEQRNSSRTSSLSGHIVENSTISGASLRQLTTNNRKQSNISRSSMLAMESIKNGDISGTSIRHLPAESREQTNISVSSIKVATNVKDRTISGLSLRQLAPKSEQPAYFSKTTLLSDKTNSVKSTQQLTTKSGEKINTSGSGILAANRAETKAVLESSSQQSVDISREQANILRSNTLSENISENRTISGSSILELVSNNRENSKVSASDTLEAGKIKISEINLRQLAPQSGERISVSGSGLLAEDIQQLDNVSISNKYTIYQNTVDELISESGVPSAESVQSKRISGTSRLSISAAKSGEQINISETSKLGDDIVESSQHSVASIPQLAAKNGKGSNVSASNILAAKSSGNSTISEISIQQLATISGEQSYFSKSSILSDRTNSRLSTQQLTPKGEEQIDISGSEKLAVDSVKKRIVYISNTQQSIAKSGEQVNVSRSNTLSGNIVENRTISGSSVRKLASSKREDSKVSGSNIAAENRTFSGISLRQLARQSGEQIDISDSGTLAEDIQQLGEEYMDNVSINDKYSVCQNIVYEIISESARPSTEIVRTTNISGSSTKQWIAEGEEQTNISGTRSEYVVDSGENSEMVANDEPKSNISGSNILSAKLLENRTISGRSIPQLASKISEESNFSKSNILNDRTNCRSNTQQLTPKNGEQINISGSEILVADSAKQRTVSGTSTKQLHATIGDQANISKSRELSENTTISRSTLRQLTPNNREDSGISLQQLVFQSGEQINIPESGILAEDVQQLDEENIDNVSISNKYAVCQDIVYELLPGSGIPNEEIVQNTTSFGSSTQQLSAKSQDMYKPIKLDAENKTMSRSNTQQIRTISGLSLRQLAPNSGEKAYFSKTSVLTSESVGNGAISGTSMRQLAAKSGDQPNISGINLKAAENIENMVISSLSPKNVEQINNARSSILGLESFEDGANSMWSIRQLAPMSGDQPYFSKSSISTTENDGNTISGSSMQQMAASGGEQTNISGLGLKAAINIENNTITRSSLQKMSSNSGEQINNERSSIPGSGNLEDGANSRSSIQRLSLKSGDQPYFSKSSIRTSESVKNGTSMGQLTVKSKEQTDIITVESIQNRSSTQLASKNGEDFNISRSSMLVSESGENGVMSGTSIRELAIKIEKQINDSDSNIFAAENVENHTGSISKQLSVKSGEQINITRSSEPTLKSVENLVCSTSGIRQFAAKSGEQVNISGSNVLDMKSEVNKNISGSSTQQLSIPRYEYINNSGSSILIAENVQDRKSSSGSTVKNLSLKSGEQITRSSDPAIKSVENLASSRSSIRQLTAKSGDQTNISGSSLLDISTKQLDVSSNDQTNISISSILNTESVKNEKISESSIHNLRVKSGEQINMPISSLLVAETVKNGSISRSSIRQLSQKSAEETNIPGSNLPASENNVSGSCIRQLTPISRETKSSVLTSKNVENRTVSGSKIQQFVVKSGDQIIIPKLCVLHVESADNATNSGVILRQLAEPTAISITSVKQKCSTGSSIQQMSQKSGDFSNISNPSIQVVQNDDNMNISGSNKDKNMDNTSDKYTICRNIVYDLISDKNLFNESTYNEEIADIQLNEDGIINDKQRASIEDKIIDQGLHYKETINKLLSNERIVNATIITNESNKTNILFKGISAVEDKSRADQKVIDEDDEEIMKKLSQEEASTDDEISYSKLTEGGEQIPFLQVSNSPSSTTTVEQMLMLNEGTIDLLDRNEKEETDERKSNKERAFDVPGEPVN